MEETFQQRITQNLTDAGCSEEQIQEFWQLLWGGHRKELQLLLARHRRHLLDCCHAEQKKMDCLDYLVYQLEQHTLKFEKE